MISPVVTSELQQVLTYVALRFTSIEEKLMATQAQTEQALTDLSAAIDDYTSDVSLALGGIKDDLATMQATLANALADDASDKALIKDLQGQLAALAGVTDTVVARAHALTDAVSAADVQVDQAP